MSWKTDPFFLAADSSGAVGHKGTGIAGTNIWVTPFFDVNFTNGYGASLSAINNGYDRTWPTIYVYGPIDNPVVANTTVEKSLVFSGVSLTSAQSIIINTKNRTVTRNDGLDLAGQINYDTSQWWALEVGSNSITLDGLNYSTVTSMTVNWNDLYL